MVRVYEQKKVQGIKMEVKKYKVVCSQPKFSDEIYIDIAPDKGIIHDQIFFSRIQLHRETSQQPLARLFGSIYLQEINNDISVEFPKPPARKDSPEYFSILKQQKELEPQIIERYRKMRQSGRESTLFVCSVNQMFELSEEKNAEADAFERKRRAKMQFIAEQTETPTDYKQKHAAQLMSQEPQTPQEEQRVRQAQKFAAARERRLVVEQKRAQDPLAAWQRFQKEYSGD